MSLQSFPDEILLEIFLHVPGCDLIPNCICVCKQWERVIQLQCLWKSKCILDFNYTIDMLKLMMPDDFRAHYFKNPYKHNLLKNPDAHDGFKHWQLKADDQFRIEIKDARFQRESRLPLYPDETIKCWIPTYRNHTKEQVIDLLERGCTATILDQVRPDIIITEWYTGHYCLEVQLLHSLQDTEPIHELKFFMRKPPTGPFRCAYFTISYFEPGLRYIKFRHGGRQYIKADKYEEECTKFALTSVRFDLNNISGTWNIQDENGEVT